MGLNLGQTLVGYSLRLCSSFVCVCVPALLVGRTHFGSKAYLVNGCPYPYTESLAWLQEVATSGSISPTARSLRESYSSRPSVATLHLPACPSLPHQWLPSLPWLSLQLTPLPSPSSFLLSKWFYWSSTSEILNQQLPLIAYLPTFFHTVCVYSRTSIMFVCELLLPYRAPLHPWN